MRRDVMIIESLCSIVSLCSCFYFFRMDYCKKGILTRSLSRAFTVQFESSESSLPAVALSSTKQAVILQRYLFLCGCLLFRLILYILYRRKVSEIVRITYISLVDWNRIKRKGKLQHFRHPTAHQQ